MPKRKYPKPPAIDQEFNEALERLAQTDPVELQGVMAAEDVGKLRLVEAEDTGHRFLIYATERGIEARLRYDGGKFWMTPSQMAQLFERDLSGITRHIDAVISEGELPAEGNLQKTQETPSARGGRPPTLCSLDMVISVAYRVTNSRQATMLRIWSTDKVVQILTKGFYVDKERLKESGAPDALDEFREIAREIRTSIRNSYREVLRLCTLCADYDGSSAVARDFFMAMENRLLWAAANKTAPQLVLERADAEMDDMGLTYYAGKRGPTQRDVVIGNNYLAQGEARTKNRITEMWLTYVEEQLDQGRLPTMEAVRGKLDGFIKFNQWPLLQDKGRHKRNDADAHALEQLDLYRLRMKAEAGKPKKLEKKG
jgi:hypothetical protein